MYTNPCDTRFFVKGKQPQQSVPVTYLSFDGTGDIAYLPSVDPVGNYPFTMAVRFRVTGAGVGTVMEFSDASEADEYFRALQRDDALLNRYQARTTGSSISTDDTSINTADGAWHTYVIVATDTTTRAFYIDGTSITPVAGTVAYGGVYDRVNVGASFVSNAIANEFTGDIRDFRMWSRSLSGSEATDFHNEATVSSTNLQIWWKFDEGTGTTANDSSGNGRDGTIDGATWGSE